MARRESFRDVAFVALASREYYRDGFIHELLAERGITNRTLSETATDIYRTLFDIFNAETYGDSIAAFVQLILKT